MMIAQQELEQMIAELGQIGAMPGGGVWRALGTEADIAARRLVTEWMVQRGLSVRTDGAGNIYGRLQGRERQVVLVGSHLDTVCRGGLYDGAAGLVAALVAVAETYGRLGEPRFTVEVVATCEEEGSRFDGGYVGSRGIVGQLTAQHLQQRATDGVTLEAALRAVGAPVDELSQAARSDIRAFIELHIEQGPILERSGAKLGVVDVVTGIRQLKVVIRGRPDHAGTTPMDLRHDALCAAAEVIARLPQIALETGLNSRATVGRLTVLPNVPNVVPGEVAFSVDLRDTEVARIDTLERRVRAVIGEHAKGMRVDIEVVGDQPPVRLDPALAQLASAVAAELGIQTIRLNSGAGHDAQVIQSVCPACLLFIPCRAGRSHCPEEYCAGEDLALGATVIAEMLRRLAW